MTGRTEVGTASFPLQELAADGTADVWLPVESSMPGKLWCWVLGAVPRCLLEPCRQRLHAPCWPAVVCVAGHVCWWHAAATLP